MSYIKKYGIGNVRLEAPYSHFIYELPLLSFGDVMHTVGVSLVFNSRLIGQNPFYMSNGHKLSLQKRLIIQGGSPGVYENGDGSRVNLIKLGNNLYTFDDDSQRIIRGTGQAYILENPDYSTETYTTLGRITSVADKYGNTLLTYAYDESQSDKLLSVTYRDNKVINLTYNNLGVVGGVEYLCNGSLICRSTLSYPGTTHTIVGHYSGVSYYTSYSSNTFTAYSANGSSYTDYSHKVTCTKAADSLTITKLIGQKTVDTTSYAFVNYDETKGINIVDVTDFQGVTTRVQFNDKKIAYSYEKLDIQFIDNELTNEQYYLGTISFYNNDNVVGAQKYCDGLTMVRETDSHHVDYNTFSSEHNFSGIITISGWLKANEDFDSCRVDVYTGNSRPTQKNIEGLIPGVWKYFTVSTNTENSPFVNVITSEKDDRLSAKDFRVTCQNVLASDGNDYKDNIIRFFDVLIYKHSDNQEYLIPINNDTVFMNGDTELSSEDYPITAGDLMRYKTNQMLGTHKNEIYFDNCRGIISSANALKVKYKINADTDTEEEITFSVALVPIGKIQSTRNATVITKSDFFTENGIIKFKSESYSGNTCIKHDIYDDKFDLIESVADGIINLYTRKANTGLVTSHTIKASSDSNQITTTATYDSENRLIKTTDEFGIDTYYTFDSVWGTLTTRTAEDGASIVDEYDDDGSSLLSKEFQKDSYSRLHALDYENGRLKSLENDSIKYFFGYSTDDNSLITTVSKNTEANTIETTTVSNDQKTTSIFYPKSDSSMIYSVVEERDKYNRIVNIGGKITNSYDLDSYFDVDSLSHKTTGIDNASSKLVTSIDLVTESTSTFFYNNDLLSLITKSASDMVPETNEQFYYDGASRLTKHILYGYGTRSLESNIEYVRGATDPLIDNRVSRYVFDMVNGDAVEKEIITSNTYDAFKRISTKSTTLNSTPFAKAFTYDKTRIASVSDTFSSSNKGTNVYTYDDYGRIETDTYSSDTTSDYKKYTYDSFGQIIRENNQALDKTFIYSYNGIGNITKVESYPYTTGEVSGTPTITNYSYSVDKLTSFDGKVITYNSIGYPTYYDGKTWQWNGGKLTRIYKGSESQPGSRFENCTFTYDGYGRRIRKYYNYDPNTSVAGDGHYYYITDYGYDTSGRLIREYITEYRDTGVTTTRELIYLYDDSGIIGLLYSINGAAANPYYYRKNAQGDVIAIYNASGSRVGEYAYDAYGNCKLVYGASTLISGINPIRYRGYYLDRETGLYYLNARYYNPQWRRFVSPDNTSAFNYNTVNGLNLYSYANNNPIGVAYKTSVGLNIVVTNNNSPFNVIAPILNQIPTNNSSFSLKPLTFSIGLVTSDNPKLPKWTNFSAFYISGHLGFGGVYSKSPGEKGSFGLSFASLELGIVNMKCDVVTFDDDTSLYLGLGAINANASIGLGLSANVEIVSFYFGAKLNEYVSIDGKVYVGWGISFDFSNGIKIGIAVGAGFEISINF